MNPPDRPGLVEAALRASYTTIAWSVVSGIAAVAVGLTDASLALAGLGFNVLLDMGASAVLVWRFRAERRDAARAARVEARAARATGVALAALAGYLGVEAVRALLRGTGPDHSIVGVLLAGVSVAVLPWLAAWKFRLGARLTSRSLRTDAVLTTVAATMAGLALLGLVANAGLEWWWADRVAALVVAVVAAAESARTLRAA